MVTLIEAAKIHDSAGTTDGLFAAGIIMQFAERSELLNAMDFAEISGSSTSYLTEERLPDVGFRGINESYIASSGITALNTESLRIIGGDIRYDKFLAKTHNPISRGVHTTMKIKSIVRELEKDFIKGDTTANPRGWDGLQARLNSGSQVIMNADGGGPLSLEKLEETMAQVDDPTHWVMDKRMRLKIQKGARTRDVAGYVTYDVDAFGRSIMRFGGLPIIEIDEDGQANKILDFNEANPGPAGVGQTPASTSIYCLSLRPMGVQGIQNGGIEAVDLGEMDAAPAYLTRIEWYVSYFLGERRSAARLNGIFNADMVV